MRQEDDLYLEDWSAVSAELFAEKMPSVQNAGQSTSTLATTTTLSTLSCPAGCIYSWTTASSSSW